MKPLTLDDIKKNNIEQEVYRRIIRCIDFELNYAPNLTAKVIKDRIKEMKDSEAITVPQLMEAGFIPQESNDLD